MRETAEKRHNDYTKAIRKRNIVYEVYRWHEGWYDNLHQYSKNKIHCSCPICRKKGKSIRDRRELEKIESEEKENYEDSPSS